VKAPHFARRLLVNTRAANKHIILTFAGTKLLTSMSLSRFEARQTEPRLRELVQIMQRVVDHAAYIGIDDYNLQSLHNIDEDSFNGIVTAIQEAALHTVKIFYDDDDDDDDGGNQPND
jgi:hypothetical protein